MVNGILHFTIPDNIIATNFSLYLNEIPIWSFASSKTKKYNLKTFKRVDYSVKLPEKLLKTLYGQAVSKILVNNSSNNVHKNNSFYDETILEFDTSKKRFEFTDSLGRPLFLSKWGFWQTLISLSPDTKTNIINSTKKLINFLNKKNYSCVITSGTLLGAVRNAGKMLTNDDDADIAVIFDTENPTEINIKSLELEEYLTQANYTVFRHSGSHLQLLFFSMLNQVEYYIDIFIGFFKQGNYCQPFHAYQPMSKEDIFPLGDISLEGNNFPAPRNTDKYLSAIYGKDWRTPDSSFEFTTPWTVKTQYDGWFGKSQGFYHNYWERYNSLKDNSSKDNSSKKDVFDSENKRFLQILQKKFNPKNPIIDIACGEGKLISKLRALNYDVLGFDYSYSALYKTNSIKDNTAQFVNLANRYSLLQFTKKIGQLKNKANFTCSWTLNTLDNYIRDNLYLFLQSWLTKKTSCLVIFDYSNDQDDKSDPNNWDYRIEEFAKELEKYNLKGEILYNGERNSNEISDNKEIFFKKTNQYLIANIEKLPT
jgi:hypothetical protein